jgi:hypothetical protein
LDSELPISLKENRVNRRQLDLIDYLQEENRVLKARLDGRRIRFTDAERRRLARKAYALGRKVLKELETLVTPDTLMRWHRQLLASKWNYSHRRGPGPAPRHDEDRRSHSAHGAGKSLVDPLFGHYGIVVLRSLLTRWRYFPACPSAASHEWDCAARPR